jgi:hypothetical protein
METPRPVTAEPAEFPRSSRQAVAPFLPVREPMVPRNALPFFVSFTSPAHTAESLPSRIPFFDARPRAGSFRLRRISSCPTARLQRKSTVCGLNGFLPSAKADGSLHLNPQPRSALLLLRLFAPCSNINCVSVLERKSAPRLIFLSKTES